MRDRGRARGVVIIRLRCIEIRLAQQWLGRSYKLLRGIGNLRKRHANASAGIGRSATRERCGASALV
jgi:hypothetical protein